jgi:hypothetical protein
VPDVPSPSQDPNPNFANKPGWTGILAICVLIVVVAIVFAAWRNVPLRLFRPTW